MSDTFGRQSRSSTNAAFEPVGDVVPFSKIHRSACVPLPSVKVAVAQFGARVIDFISVPSRKNRQ